MLDICSICDGHCCFRFSLYFNGSKRSLYKNSKRLKDLGVIIKVGDKEFTCINYTKERVNGGHCKDYDNRPYFCKGFICSEAVDILDLVQEKHYNKKV